MNRWTRYHIECVIEYLKKLLILRSWAWHATPFLLGLRNFRKNFNFFEFRFLGLNDRKYVETCPNKKFFGKKLKMKIFPLRGRFWDLEIFGKISNFSIFVFWA